MRAQGGAEKTNPWWMEVRWRCVVSDQCIGMSLPQLSGSVPKGGHATLQSMDLTAVLILAYFALLFITLLWSSKVIQGPWLFFLRAFFPNWKFFHAVGHVPHLYVRGEASGVWTDWHLVYPRVQRRWHHVFHNPAVNLALSHQNLVDHFASDLNALPDGADASQLATYRLVSRLAHQAIRGDAWGDTPMISASLPVVARFQFELRMELPDPVRSELMLQSPVMDVWS